MADLLELLKSGKQLELELIAGDELAEVMVIDGELRAVAREIGRLTVKLPAGVYKIKQRLGDRVSERVIFLNRDGQEETFTSLDTGSAVPMPEEEKANESVVARQPTVGTGYDRAKWQALCFSKRSSRVTVQGQGAEISLFFRTDDLALETSHDDTTALISSFDLLDRDGESVLGGPQEILCQGLDGGCYSLTVQVNPGPHYLTLYAPGGSSLIRMATQQTIFASPGWQTRIYGFLVPSGPLQETLLQVDGERISINMARVGHTPARRDMRLIETARQALIAGQHIDLADRRGAYLGDFEDPILGLFIAYFILQQKNRQRDGWLGGKDGDSTGALAAVVEKLGSVLSPADVDMPLHPDVAALSALTGRREFSVAYPPMLLDSWNVLVELSFETKHDLIEINSDVERISTHVVSGRPWMRWEAPRATTKIWQIFRTARRSLGGLIWDERLEVLPEKFSQAEDNRRDLLMDTVVNTVLAMGAENEGGIVKDIADGGMERLETARSMLTNEASDDQTLQRSLVQKLRLPRSKVEKMLRDFQSGTF